ncbi:MAG: DUF368 domain-containing protein [Canibacter sp.]
MQATPGNQSDETPQATEHIAHTVERKTSIVGNFVRGALIGAVETVPGVSGGTVALVVGIYHQIIDSASAVIAAVRKLITGPHRRESFRNEMAKVHWKVIIPVLIGMLLSVFLIAGPMADLMETYPVQMRGLFFGMVLASTAVPVRMIVHDQRLQRSQLAQLGEDTTHIRLRARHFVFATIAAAATFFVVSLPPTEVKPTPIVIICAAAIAISALVLPGLSGSFLLLTFGLYEPTLRAVDERDLAYLGIFMLGALIGMVVIVKLLKWLLTNYHTATLAVLTGVMLGGLRTLWPWQGESRSLLAAPQASEAWMLAGLALVGIVVVAVLIVADARVARRDLERQLRANKPG